MKPEYDWKVGFRGVLTIKKWFYLLSMFGQGKGYSISSQSYMKKLSVHIGTMGVVEYPQSVNFSGNRFSLTYHHLDDKAECFSKVTTAQDCVRRIKLAHEEGFEPPLAFTQWVMKDVEGIGEGLNVPEDAEFWNQINHAWYLGKILIPEAARADRRKV